MSPVSISGVDKQGVAVNGVQVKQSLSGANETVEKGVYAPTTLSTVDSDLAVANIKDGVTIFGFLGTLTPGVDVSDADAAVTDVKDTVTFYSVAAPRKTGTMPTVAIVAANDNYPAGYHAGDAGGLDAIEVNLASANIKSGVTIFGKAGAATVQEIGAADALVTDVKDPKTFFSVTGAIKTGTMPTVALDPALDSYPAGYHAGAASLHAVDADLAAGNIKSGVTIFGILGTYAGGTLGDDITGSAPSTLASVTSGGYYLNQAISASSEVDLATKTLTFAAGSRAAAIGFMCGAALTENTIKLRVYQNGVQTAESAYVATIIYSLVIVGTVALSGSKICKLTAYNYDASNTRNLHIAGARNGDYAAAAIGVASMKAV